MATSQTATVYSKATGVGATGLVMLAVSTGDGADKSITFEYYVELTAGQAATRVPISREDFLAIRQLRNLATP